MTRPKILCVDFDGVLHSYRSGWKGVDQIPDPPVVDITTGRTAIDWLRDLLWASEDGDDGARFEVCIYSSRSKVDRTEGTTYGTVPGINAMRAWLIKYGLEPDLLETITFPTEKPPAWLTIDDRAWRFCGRFPKVSEIEGYVPWHRRPEPNEARTAGELMDMIARAPRSTSILGCFQWWLGKGTLEVSDFFNGIGLRTEKALFGVAERDGGLEVLRDGKLVWSSEHGEPFTPGAPVGEFSDADLRKMADEALGPEAPSGPSPELPVPGVDLLNWLRLYTWIQDDGAVDFSRPRVRPQDLDISARELEPEPGAFSPVSVVQTEDTFELSADLCKQVAQLLEHQAAQRWAVPPGLNVLLVDLRSFLVRFE